MGRFKTFVAVAAIGLVAGSCGGADAEVDGVASLDDVVSDPASVADESVPAETALLEFSECMRDNDIDIPDIGLDENGGPDLSDPSFRLIDIESREFQQALDTCQPILARVEAFRFAFDPELQSRVNDQLLVLAECMRTSGYEDFPDPTGMLAAPFPPELAERVESDPEMQAVAEECAADAFAGLPVGPGRGRG